MKERVAVPMLINEIKEAQKGDILVFDGKRWIPATFGSVAEKITAEINKVSEDTQKTLLSVSTKLDKVCEDYEKSETAYKSDKDKSKLAFAVSMAFNKIAIDEIIGDSECADFESLKEWHNQYVNGSTDKLSDDTAFLKYFALFSK